MLFRPGRVLACEVRKPNCDVCGGSVIYRLNRSGVPCHGQDDPEVKFFVCQERALCMEPCRTAGKSLNFRVAFSHRYRLLRNMNAGNAILFCLLLYSALSIWAVALNGVMSDEL
jgi:hypothetical protein